MTLAVKFLTENPLALAQLKGLGDRPGKFFSALILGTGMDTQDTSPSVFLFFHNERFIFNAGESIRLSYPRFVKPEKADILISEPMGGADANKLDEGQIGHYIEIGIEL
ncbi:zinc phosphodiesterase ELAC protein 2-like [Senna tora]|uniref:Zinc phosphodiesterase ELAC protein 2-like n=1 Tax=Senna tora TaxID=362788 RepID=A0A834SU64_9FABA|nr:zinc phosphodiesterase ELAC protein 2-like [Senna tora]